MERFAAQIDYYLEMFRRGDTDNAFHGLLEIDSDILPELIQVFRASHDLGVLRGHEMREKPESTQAGCRSQSPTTHGMHCPCRHGETSPSSNQSVPRIAPYA